MQTDVIRRISIEATQNGVAETTAGLKGLSGAQDGIVASSERVSRSQLSVANAYERQQRSLDISYRSTQAFEKAQRTLDQALQQGITTAQRHAELSALNAGKHNLLTKAANDNTVATSLNRSQLLELGHAAKASFEQLAAGTPILTILAQQGATTAQALSLGSGGVGGSLKSIASSAVAFLGPVGLVAAGFLAVEAAAFAMFALLKKEAPTAETLLAEHDRLLKVIKDSYDAVTQSAKFWIDQSKDTTRLQLLQQEVDLREKLVEATAKAIKPTVRMDIFTGDVDVKEQFRAFRDALATLNEGWQSGVPDVRAYVDEVTRIGLASPSLQKLSVELIKNIGDAANFTAKLKQIKEELSLLDGHKPSESGKRTLGLPDGGSSRGPDPFLAQENSIRKHIAAMEADAKSVEATAGEHARLRVEAQLLDVATRNGAKATEEQKMAIEELGRAASDAAMKLSRAQVQSQIKFGKDTTFLSQEDVQIAASLKSIYPDVATALNSVEAAEMRVTNAQHLMSEGFREVGKAMLSAFLSGGNAMDALVQSLDNVAKKLADSGFDNMLSGILSMNPVQAGLGAAQAAGSALISAFTGDQKKQEELRKARAEWEKAGPAFSAFLKQMTGGVTGNLSQSIADAAAREAAFEDQAWKARDTGAINAARDGIVKFTQTQKELFNATFDASLAGLNDGLGLDSPFMKSVENIKSALVKQLAFVDDTDVARGGRAVDIAKQSSQAYLLSLLQQPKALSAVEVGLMQIRGTAHALQGALVQLGMSSDDAAKAISTGVTAAIAGLKKQFEGGLTERLNTANGQSFLNDATKLIAQHQRDILDAASLGTNPALVAATFRAEAQQIVNSAGLVGDAFTDFTKQFPDLAGVVKEATGDMAASAKQLQDSLNASARSITDYVNGLFAGPNSSLSPTAQLTAAQSSYNAKLALAQGGNVDAQSTITQDAENFRLAARAVFASGSGYQAIFSQITSQLLALPAVQNTTDPVVQATRDVLAAIVAGNATQATQSTLAAVASTSQSMNYYTSLAASNAATSNSLLTTSNSLTTTANNLSSGQTSILQAIQSLNQTSATQLTLLQNALAATFNAAQYLIYTSPGSTGSGSASSTQPLQNQMVQALNKIVWNTYATAINTAWATTQSNDHHVYGTYAAGGVIPPHGLGLVSEHLNPTWVRAGNDPITVSPFPAAGNDNGGNAALLAEVRALRNEVVRLQNIVMAGDNMNAKATVETGASVTDATVSTSTALRAEMRMRKRDQRAA